MIKEKDKGTIDRQTVFDWAPLLLIVGGLGLNRLEFFDGLLITYVGFLSYGVLGLIDLWSNKNSKRLFFKILKITTLLLIVIIALAGVLGSTYSMILLSLVLMDRIIFTSTRVELDTKENAPEQ